MAKRDLWLASDEAEDDDGAVRCYNFAQNGHCRFEALPRGCNKSHKPAKT
jgi:hypothetical protein